MLDEEGLLVLNVEIHARHDSHFDMCSLTRALVLLSSSRSRYDSRRGRQSSHFIARPQVLAQPAPHFGASPVKVVSDLGIEKPVI